MTCKNCGKEFFEKNGYCSACGERLDTSTSKKPSNFEDQGNTSACLSVALFVVVGIPVFAFGACLLTSGINNSPHEIGPFHSPELLSFGAIALIFVAALVWALIWGRRKPPGD